MPFEKFKRRMTASTDELHRATLEDRYAGLDLVRISEAPMREPVRIGGEVEATQLASRTDCPSLEVTVSDGSAQAIAVFLGRKRIPALTPGTHLVLEGVLHVEGNRTLMLNPAYTLVPS
jgi:hypothetical protein